MATRIRYSAVPFKERKNENTSPDDGKKNNILSVVNPELAKEWHPTKNGSLTSDMVTAGSGKKVWWLGKCGHEWQAIITSRNKGNGCPYCANKKVLQGFNDLATTNPELAAEWCSIMNGKLTPSMVTEYSNKKAWWICKYGHKWQSIISNRTKGRGCPYCIGKKVLKGYNDLFTNNPRLAAEWHSIKNGNLTPDMITVGCNKKVWWICKYGHEWQATINHRNMGHGCPYCTNQKVKKGFNDLATIKPCIASEWNVIKNGTLKPEMITVSSSKKVWWKCKQGHEWQATVAHRNTGQGCPYCSGHKVLKGFNDLATVNPSLTLEWHPTKNGEITSNEVTAGSNKKVWWKCKQGHEWQAKISDRSKGMGCPYCSNKRILEGFNDLESINKVLASEWHPTKNKGLMPNMVSRGSTKEVWWLGKCGHEWKSTVLSRSIGSRCPVCRREAKTSFPEQAVYFYVKKFFPCAISRDISFGKELDIYIPSIRTGIEYDGSFYHNNINRDKQKNKWCKNQGIRLIRIREEKCPKLDDADIIIRHGENDESLQDVIVQVMRLLGIIDCRIDIDKDRASIYNQYIEMKKQNSLASLYPEIASEWHPTKNLGLLPDMISSGSDKKVWWLGKCGHEWQEIVANRIKKRGCPYCSGHRVLVGFNDLLTRNPELAGEWHPTKNGKLTPSMVSEWSGKKVWWIGKCGHEWQSTINDRSRGTNCPYCSGQKVIKGFNDIETVNPRLSSEWHPTKNGELTSYMFTPGSGRKVWWLGKCGHEWQSIIYSRSKGNGCPICARQKRKV